MELITKIAVGRRPITDRYNVNRNRYRFLLANENTSGFVIFAAYLICPVLSFLPIFCRLATLRGEPLYRDSFSYWNLDILHSRHYAALQRILICSVRSWRQSQSGHGRSTQSGHLLLSFAVLSLLLLLQPRTQVLKDLYLDAKYFTKMGNQSIESSWRLKRRKQQQQR